MKEQQSSACLVSFVNLQTGYGKSLIFQMASLVACEMSSKRPWQFSSSSSVLIVSRLVSLMKDQVSALRPAKLHTFGPEVQAVLTHSCIMPAFLKIKDFHNFSGFIFCIHPKFCTVSLVTDFLVCIFLPSNVLLHLV